MDDENELVEKIVSAVEDAAKNLAGKAAKKLLVFLLPAIGVVLLLLAVLWVVFGAADSLVEAVSEVTESSGSGASVFDGMTQEEIEEWMNDPENIYNAFQDGTLDLDGASLDMLDEDTTKRIFERIHAYQERRSMSKEVTYTYRMEDKYDADGEEIELEDMDVYGTISKDSDSSPDGVDYDGEKTVTIERGEVENDLDENGTSIFDIRWQPIYALCAIAAVQNYDNWGTYRDVDNDAKTLEEMDLQNYYLSDNQIDDIIDIFYFKADYYYDAVNDETTAYKFKDMGTQTGAFRLVVTGDDTYRITERIPCSAPHRITNAYISYEYQYDTDGKCISRMYTCIPTSFISACEEAAPGFEMDWFLEILEILPGTEDICAEFEADEFETLMVTNTYCTDPALCPTIGIYYHVGDSTSGSSGGSLSYEGSFTVPYYDYIMEGTTHLGDVYFIADNKPEGADYGLYEISNTALKPFTQSDGLSAEQLANVISNSSYYTDAGAMGCVLFDTAEHIEKTAQVIAEYQDENNVSSLFYLAIMRTEGAIKSTYGKDYYNFFNFTSSTYVIPGSKGFRDYKSEFGDAWAALEEQLGQIYDRYVTARGQINYYQMAWNGYDGDSYDSISYSYCPPFDDTSMPWAEGSWYNTGSGNIDVSGGVGWVNSNAAYRTALEEKAEELGYTLTLFSTEDVTEDVVGSSLWSWFTSHSWFGSSDSNQAGD